MESEYFIFDNVKSTDMDIYIIRMDSGLAKFHFWRNRYEEKQTRSRIAPYILVHKKSQYNLLLQISPVDKKWTPA